MNRSLPTTSQRAEIGCERQQTRKVGPAAGKALLSALRGPEGREPSRRSRQALPCLRGLPGRPGALAGLEVRLAACSGHVHTSMLAPGRQPRGREQFAGPPAGRPRHRRHCPGARYRTVCCGPCHSIRATDRVASFSLQACHIGACDPPPRTAAMCLCTSAAVAAHQLGSADQPPAPRAKVAVKRCPSFSSRPGFPKGLRVLLVEGEAGHRDSTARLMQEELAYQVGNDVLPLLPLNRRLVASLPASGPPAGGVWVGRVCPGASGGGLAGRCDDSSSEPSSPPRACRSPPAPAPARLCSTWRATAST